MKIAILSNINLDLLIERMSKKHEVFKPDGYGIWVQSLLSAKSKLFQFNPECVFVILDADELIKGQTDYESSLKELDKSVAYIENTVIQRPDISFFVSDFDYPQKRLINLKRGRDEKLIENFWYNRLLAINNAHENIYIFEFKKLVEQIGRDKFYSQKLWYAGGIKYSLNADKLLERTIEKYIKALLGHRKKCLILDLDNTLWGKVLGEEGLNGIELSEYKEGAQFKDFQKRIKEIKEMGILIAVVSKNNFDDVEEVFENHNHMVLRKDDFVSMKVNWEIKTQNITQLSEELNIGLDTFVFIDDNPIERESVKDGLPQVTVPEFPKDSSKLEDFITDLYNDYFFTLKITEEDEEKTTVYQQQQKREGFKNQSVSYHRFLENLGTKIVIWTATTEDFPRIMQLVQKTNQFNLTTKRYTEKEISSLLLSDKHTVFVAAVEDKFGDNGKVSLMIISEKDDEAYIDTFILSCRVMGRFIEDQLLDFVEDRYLKKEYKMFHAYYFPTKKNIPVADLYDRLGYQIDKIDDDGNKVYRLLLNKKDKGKRNSYGKIIEK